MRDADNGHTRYCMYDFMSHDYHCCLLASCIFLCDNTTICCIDVQMQLHLICYLNSNIIKWLKIYNLNAYEFFKQIIIVWGVDGRVLN